MTAQAFIKRDFYPLPPPIYGICDIPDHWQISLFGNGQTVTIRKPIRNGIDYKIRAGLLTFLPSAHGVTSVRYGDWQLSTDYLKKKGWVLTIGLKGRNNQWTNIPFGFRDRFQPGLSPRVREINKQLARHLGSPKL